MRFANVFSIISTNVLGNKINGSKLVRAHNVFIQIVHVNK